jgi:hypothetical protein
VKPGGRWGAALLVIAFAVSGCKYWYKPVPVANAIGEEKAVLAGDTMRVYREARFELYGPDEQAVYDGYEQMNRAYRAFERLFGTEPPHLAVLLAKDTALAVDSATARAFAARGFRFLRYVRPKPEYQRYGTQAYGGILWPVAPTVARLMLAHFAQTQDPQSGGSAPDSVALARFPVWYRAAVMHLIGESAVSNDLEFLRDEKNSWMPLQELLTLVRSPAGDSALDPSRRGNADQTSRIIAAQAATVAQYLVEHEGAAVMRRLAQGYLAGRPLADMLGELSATARSVPQLEQNWKVWVRTNGE